MVLSSAAHTQLRRCSCGNVQVQIGPTSVVMDRRVAQELLETLAHGMSVLAGQELAEARGYGGLQRPAKSVVNN